MAPAGGRGRRGSFPIVLLVLILLATACSGSSGSTTTAPPAAPTTTTTTSPATTTTTLPPRAESADTAALQAAVDDWITGSTSAGVTAAVLWPDGSGWEGAAGLSDEVAGITMEAGDRSRIASITKFFVALTVVGLAGDGALDLDDPAAGLLPDLGLDGEITVRHLLGHLSGLWNYTVDPGLAHPGEPVGPVEVVRAALERGSQFPAGTHFAYSNTNYQVLGLVIEAVTGRPAHEVIRSRILDPLGLEQTFMAGRESGEVDALPFGGSESTDDTEALSAWADGGMVSTASELTRVAAAFASGEVVGPQQRDEMLAESRPGSEYGLGVQVLDLGGREAWGHTGGMPGYLAAVFFFPDSGIAVAALSNDWRGGDLWELVETLAGLAER